MGTKRQMRRTRAQWNAKLAALRIAAGALQMSRALGEIAPERFRCGAEGATAPEPLRQKDQLRAKTLESDARTTMPRRPPKG